MCWVSKSKTEKECWEYDHSIWDLHLMTLYRWPVLCISLTCILDPAIITCTYISVSRIYEHLCSEISNVRIRIFGLRWESGEQDKLVSELLYESTSRQREWGKNWGYEALVKEHWRKKWRGEGDKLRGCISKTPKFLCHLLILQEGMLFLA